MHYRCPADVRIITLCTQVIYAGTLSVKLILFETVFGGRTLLLERSCIASTAIDAGWRCDAYGSLITICAGGRPFTRVICVTVLMFDFRLPR